MSSPAGGRHHFECRFISYAELWEGWEEALPDELDPEWAKQAGVIDCHQDCSELECAKARGRELAKEHGW